MHCEPRDCFACKCDVRPVRASTAFLAGIAFALQHNARAISTRICAEHAEDLKRGHDGTIHLMKEGNER
jgi:hypothetical protein